MFVEIPANRSSIAQRKTVYGIAVNDSDYNTESIVNGKREVCPYYRRWKDMLKRCYCEKFHIRRPTYKDCTVCDEWLLFSNFRNWMKSQEWDGLYLDKDIMSPGNRIYSPSTCIFVSVEINNLIGDAPASRGKYPRGVSFSKERNLYEVRSKQDGTYKYIGRFSSVTNAAEAYKKSRYKYLMGKSETQEDIRIKQGLKLHAEFILNK